MPRSALIGIILAWSVFLFASNAHAAIVDGDLIKTAVHENVYIVKIVGPKKFKRLILNPDIFNQYAHLKWSNIKTITEAEFGQYALSYLVREINDQQVYRLYPDEDTGTKRALQMMPGEFESLGLDWDSIYIMNAHERDSYFDGSELTFQNYPRPKFAYGITPGISSTADINTLADLGVDAVRIRPEDLSFTKRDLQGRGIDMLVVEVDQKPSNLSGVPPPENEDQWVQDLQDLVRKHPDVLYWEVWNEPNEILFWYPTPNAAAYVRLLRKAYIAIKSANPNALVVSAGLSGVNPPRQYLRDMYRAGARTYFDVLALHPYRQPQSPDSYLADYLRFMKNIMETNGDLDTPIWITEIGWPTDPSQYGAVTEAQQAEFLRRTYEISKSLGFVEKVFWYRLQDAGEGMGILGKPAEDVYRKLAQ
jgi:putative glycosyl hydrolase